MLPLVLGGWIASFAVLASFFYHHLPENAVAGPKTYTVVQGVVLAGPEAGKRLPASMLPSYAPGESVTIVPMYLDEVQSGRIIAFNGCLSKILISIGRDMPPFLHRVVSVGADKHGWYAITKGDSLPERDWCKVRERDLLGIVPQN